MERERARYKKGRMGLMATSYSRGHKIYFDHQMKEWKYLDDNTSTSVERPCKRCGKMPTKDGGDACLGHIPGAISACCGHGVSRKFILFKERR